MLVLTFISRDRFDFVKQIPISCLLTSLFWRSGKKGIDNGLNVIVGRINLAANPRCKSRGRGFHTPRNLTRMCVRLDECASEGAHAAAGWLWRAMRPGSKFNRLASRWLGVMTTRAAGSTSANWGQPCQTTAIGCWETNVVVLPSTDESLARETERKASESGYESYSFQ